MKPNNKSEFLKSAADAVKLLSKILNLENPHKFFEKYGEIILDSECSKLGKSKASEPGKIVYAESEARKERLKVKAILTIDGDKLIKKLAKQKGENQIPRSPDCISILITENELYLFAVELKATARIEIEEKYRTIEEILPRNIRLNKKFVSVPVLVSTKGYPSSLRDTFRKFTFRKFSIKKLILFSKRRVTWVEIIKKFEEIKSHSKK